MGRSVGLPGAREGVNERSMEIAASGIGGTLALTQHTHVAHTYTHYKTSYLSESLSSLSLSLSLSLSIVYLSIHLYNICMSRLSL